jgi:hypothetical protein
MTKLDQALAHNKTTKIQVILKIHKIRISRFSMKAGASNLMACCQAHP